VISDAQIKTFLRKLPKAELHLHLEGMLQPDRVKSLAKKYSISLDDDELRSRYNLRGFSQFLELFKWATSFLREPGDYAELAHDAATALHEQHVVYAEITLSVGVMLLRKQNVSANFAALREVFARNHAAGTGPQAQFIFDAVRQFGPAPAMEVARLAAEHRHTDGRKGIRHFCDELIEQCRRQENNADFFAHAVRARNPSVKERHRA